MQSSWLFLGDAWGFGDLMKRQPEQALDCLKKASGVVRRLSEGHQSVRYFMFSDSIVCARLFDGTGPDAQRLGTLAFSELAAAVEYLIEKFLEAGLLLRGGVVFGPLHWQDDIVFGEALREAASFEKSAVAPPLVFLPVSALLRARAAGCLSHSIVEDNMALSMYVTAKDGGLFRALPLVGDQMHRLETRLADGLHDLTLSVKSEPRSAAAVYAAVEIIRGLKEKVSGSHDNSR